MKSLLTLFLFIMIVNLHAQDQTIYQIPPKEIYDLIMADPTPSISIDDTGKWMLLLDRHPFTSVAELAEPELRIAGLRINPKNFAQSRMNTFYGLRLQNLTTMKEHPIAGLPENLKATGFQWNPKQNKIGFLNITDNAVDLYIIDIQTFTAQKANQLPLNIVLGNSFSWIDDNSLLYKTVLQQISVPEKPSSPNGPVIQESTGKKAAARTYQDLIKSAYDESLFEYYSNAQLVINTQNIETKIGVPSMLKSFAVSPDRKYILIQTIKKPLSYMVPESGFPNTVSVIDMQANPIKLLAENPSTENVPIGFDDAPDFPRSFSWRNDLPSTVTYIKALDGGLGKSKSDWRDALMSFRIEAPAGEPELLFKTSMRFQGIIWGNKTIAVYYEESYDQRKVNMHRYNPANGTTNLIYTRSSNDLYADIGDPLTQKNEFERQVLIILNNKELVLNSAGASTEGNMPLIQTMDITTEAKKLIWKCESPYYEQLFKLIDPHTMTFITSRESQKEITNYYLYTNQKNKFHIKALTSFKNPYTQLEGVKRQKISYTRTDGITLSGNLYLPKNYDTVRDGKLPVLIWAYPQEYKSDSDASQIRGSKNTFTRPFYGSPVLWVTRGYAVLDNAEMPIVGGNGKEPNDSFISQLYLNAHAAIQKLSDLGVGDSTRVAVGGHSYGAFMVANLLAHTSLFKAGIARSGAYNRTLTPFGFQGEERTYWEAPEVYNTMSPFAHADKIKTPLLLIHGDSDNNSGTFPLQSERLFAAIKGLGGTARFVSLPHESHGYTAKENILHMLWETDQWLEKYVKQSIK